MFLAMASGSSQVLQKELRSSATGQHPIMGSSIPEVAHGLQDSIIKLNGPWDEQGSMFGLGRHACGGGRRELATLRDRD